MTSQISGVSIVYSTGVQAQIKKNIKAPSHWPLWGEFTGDRWIPHTKGQGRGKCLHVITSSRGSGCLWTGANQNIPLKLILNSNFVKPWSSLKFIYEWISYIYWTISKVPITMIRSIYITTHLINTPCLRARDTLRTKLFPSRGELVNPNYYVLKGHSVEPYI